MQVAGERKGGREERREGIEKQRGRERGTDCSVLLFLHIEVNSEHLEL